MSGSQQRPRLRQTEDLPRTYDDATPIASRPMYSLPARASSDRAVPGSGSNSPRRSARERPDNAEQLRLLKRAGILSQEQYEQLVPPPQIVERKPMPPQQPLILRHPVPPARDKREPPKQTQVHKPRTAGIAPLTDDMIKSHIDALDKVKQLGDTIENLEKRLEKHETVSTYAGLESRLVSAQAEQNHLIGLCQIFVHAHGGRDYVAQRVERVLAERERARAEAKAQAKAARGLARKEAAKRKRGSSPPTPSTSTARRPDPPSMPTKRIDMRPPSRFASAHGMMSHHLYSNGPSKGSHRSTEHSMLPLVSGSRSARPSTSRRTTSFSQSSSQSKGALPSFNIMRHASPASASSSVPPSPLLLPGQLGHITLSPDPSHSNLDADLSSESTLPKNDWSNWSTTTSISAPSSISSASSTTEDASSLGRSDSQDHNADASATIAESEAILESLLLSNALARDLALNATSPGESWTPSPDASGIPVNPTPTHEPTLSWLAQLDSSKPEGLSLLTTDHDGTFSTQPSSSSMLTPQASAPGQPGSTSAWRGNDAFYENMLKFDQA